MALFLFNNEIYEFFIIISKYSYRMFICLHRVSWHTSATLTEVFPCFFFSCKVNGRVKPTKMGHGHTFYFCFVLCIVFVCHFVFCLCENVHCTTATTATTGYPIAVNRYNST